MSGKKKTFSWWDERVTLVRGIGWGGSDLGFRGGKYSVATSRP